MATDPLDIMTLWPQSVCVSQLGKTGLRRALQADEPVRTRIARALGLNALASLEANLRVTPWLDGVEIEGDWRAVVGQTCGVTLEPFQTELLGHLHRRAAPEGSPALGEPAGEIDVDPEAEDPPDRLDGDQVNLGAYVLEDLSLAIDPFPKKPGATFEAPASKGEPSPFAVLAKLKGGAPDA